MLARRSKHWTDKSVKDKNKKLEACLREKLMVCVSSVILPYYMRHEWAMPAELLLERRAKGS